MRRQLQKRFEVIDVFPLDLPGESLWLPVRTAYRLAGRYHHPMREPAVLKALAHRIERQVKNARPDALFAPSSVPMTCVETDVPQFHCTDQVFCDFVNSYIARPARRFLRLGNSQEAQALTRATRVSFPSDWAAQSAAEHYGADPAKIAVIPWGGNLPREIGDEEVAAAIAARRLSPCELVFIGVDWRRKGGDTLVETVMLLNRAGLETHATIIGCEPPGLPTKHFATHRFLDKQRPEHFAQFGSIMRRATFYFMPSRAEAFGQAFCEAAAFGVPSIGSTAGGIPTIVHDGVTGRLLPANAPAERFAATIAEAVDKPDAYRLMAAAARADSHRRLNWDAFGRRLGDLIESQL